MAKRRGAAKKFPPGGKIEAVNGFKAYCYPVKKKGHIVDYTCKKLPARAVGVDASTGKVIYAKAEPRKLEGEKITYHGIEFYCAGRMTKKGPVVTCRKGYDPWDAPASAVTHLGRARRYRRHRRAR